MQHLTEVAQKVIYITVVKALATANLKFEYLQLLFD